MANWLQAYTASWRVVEVNPDTWADGRVIGGVESVSVERSATDSVPLIDSGTMTLSSPIGETWCRVQMAHDGERFDIATLLFQSTSSRTDKGTSYVADGYSVLKPADDMVLTRGTYAPKGVNGAAFAASLLSECVKAPIEVEGSFVLGDHVVFDLGSTYLEAVWAVLDAGGFCIQTDGHGTIHVRELPEEPSLYLDRLHSEIVGVSVDDELNLSAVPNRYYAVDGNDFAMAVNDDPDSPTSYSARGRYVDAIDTSVTKLYGETLSAYASRKLKEASTVTRRRSYTREYWPDVHPLSIVRGALPKAGLSGDMRVQTQSITCGKGITVHEVAGLEVSLT